MPYLANLRDICGSVLDPAWCLAGCFLLIAVGIWSFMSVAKNRHRAKMLSAGVVGAVLVAAALPGVIFSETWITCSLTDRASPSADLAPTIAIRKAWAQPRRRII